MFDSLEQIIARAEQTLGTLTSRDERDLYSEVLQFGIDIGEIGRALVLNPELRPVVAAFVARTEDKVADGARLALWLHRISRAADSRSSETFEYTSALAMRSDLEFFCDLYRDTAARSRVEEIDTSDIDEDLKQWGAVQYLSEIPSGIPAAHVWWHQSLSGL